MVLEVNDLKNDSKNLNFKNLNLDFSNNTAMTSHKMKECVLCHQLLIPAFSNFEICISCMDDPTRKDDVMQHFKNKGNINSDQIEDTVTWFQNIEDPNTIVTAMRDVLMARDKQAPIFTEQGHNSKSGFLLPDDTISSDFSRLRGPTSTGMAMHKIMKSLPDKFT